MPQAYSRIMFTPAVKALQERMGSRAQYAFLDAPSSTDETLGARECAFIAACDTLFQATVGETGWPYVQHRGGPRGFVKVLDARRIAYPDFRGNVQYLSVAHLARDDRISLILVDPAGQRRLKLLGRARLVDAGAEPELFARLHLDGYEATVERAFVVEVAGHDWNCPQHIVPRFTEHEIAVATAPLRARAERAEQRVAELERATTAGAGRPRTWGCGPLPLVVSGLRELTPRIRAFELRHVDGAPLPAFGAGAHLALPVVLADGTEATRNYSIASDPCDRRRYEVSVLREEEGRGGSSFAHAQWALGTVLRTEAPVNHFALRDGAEPSLLIGGGIGITPLRSMALQLLRDGRGIELHHAVRSIGEAAYADDLALLLGPRYTLYPSDAGHRLDIGRLLRQAGESGARIYVCGPPRLIAAVRERALADGMDAGRIHAEPFGAPAGDLSDAAIEVTLRRSDRIVRVSPRQSILEAVERAGVPVAASCRVGICRTCVVKVLAGEPDHRDEVLTPAERARDGLMCICVSRARSGALTLDL